MANSTGYDQIDQLDSEHHDDTNSRCSSSSLTDDLGNQSGRGDLQLTNTASPSANGDHLSDVQEISIDEAIERLGFGLFQMLVLAASGLCFAADAMQVVLLSFLAIVLQSNWNLSDEEAASITSIIFLGALFGTMILGPLADSVGRRPIFLLAALEITLFGVGASLANTYRQMLFMIFMVGMGVGGLTVPFDILAEFLPSAGRGKKLLAIEYFWTCGVLYVVLVAYATLHSAMDEWRQFVALCSVPCLLSLILGYLYVPESPRWLLVKNRPEEALDILREAATRNGLDALEVFPESLMIAPEPDHEEASFVDLFKPEWRRIILLLWGAWFFFPIGYYGTIMLSTRVFETSPDDAPDAKSHYNFDYSAIFVSSAAEIIGTTLVIFLVDRVGRIQSQMASYALAGIFNFCLCTFASWGLSLPILIFFNFLARIFEMSASCVTWVSTAEILTTEVRTTGHSTANAVARIGAFISPYLIEGKTSLAVIGVFLLITHAITVICVSQLPETMGRVMSSQSDRDYSPVNHEHSPAGHGHIS